MSDEKNESANVPASQTETVASSTILGKAPKGWKKVVGATARSRLNRWLDNNINTIDQIRQHLPHNCFTNTRTGFSFKGTLPNGKTAIRHAKCRKLTCKYCFDTLYDQFRKSIYQAIEVHDLRYFITLTLPPVPVHNQETKLKEALSLLLLDVKRSFKPQSLSYFWVLGSNGSGNAGLHIHMLVNIDIHRGTHYKHRGPWLKDTWFRLTKATQVSFKPITPGTESNVVAYLLFNLFFTVLARPCLKRRYGCSRNIKLNPKPVRDPSRVKFTHQSKPSAYYARVNGIDSNSLVNPQFEIDSAAPAALGTSQPEPPLTRSAAGTTGPAGGRGVAVLPFIPPDEKKG